MKLLFTVMWLLTGPLALTQDQIPITSSKFSLIFSHNINAELAPCGCSQEPRGGLLALANLLTEKYRNNQILYIDSGDLLFDSQIFPDWQKNYNEQKAIAIWELMSSEDVNLKYFLLGDQDLALGINFLQKLQRNNTQIKFLLSNLNDQKNFPIKTVPYVHLHDDDRQIFVLGMLDPTLLTADNARHFILAAKALPQRLIELTKSSNYDPNNPKHCLILVSHSGLDDDLILAKKFPMIDWIIGAHTQNKTDEAYKVGKTQIVQVLNKNYFVGEILFDLNTTKNSDLFRLLDTQKATKSEKTAKDFALKIKQIEKKLANYKNNPVIPIIQSDTNK